MVVFLILVIAGATLMVGAALAHRTQRQRSLDVLLGMTTLSPDEDGVDHHVSQFADRAVDLAAQIVERVDRGRSLSSALERAKVPLRPGEFVVVMVGAVLAVAAVLLLLTDSIPMALAGGVATAVVGVQLVRRRVSGRRRAFEQQLPDALSLTASSLTAGHTFLRSIQMMCEEASPPLSEEFARVVAETRLGDPLVAALERMAARLQVRDMEMVVQAIRIQQTVGGRLADLLHTLSDFIRARDEVRREVKVLTAEGRMSAYVLAALVPLLFLVMQVLNPEYVQPLYSGWGLVLLAGCGTSVAMGVAVILRMVKIDI